MKEKNQNFFFELELKVDLSIKIAFWADARSRTACEYFGDVILFDTIYNTNSMILEITSGFQSFSKIVIFVYTHEKFRKVQVQFRGKVNCITRSMHYALGYTIYEVVKQVSNSMFNKFVITYDRVSFEVKCQCLLFESRGI
ncbi:hypothetical protein Ahy_A01g001983 [Arachis hypogaea]|uniref:Uncharacterized protein n=1 Tax=Arachis hypogaea TaxID=3818 RepID=A0A445EQB8_ARAHY|nr:hypothetical protein Ahy_A01g001983 [Arachis hypogaea]